MVTDQIADLLTRIRNAQGAGHPTVMIPASTAKASILTLLREEGYVGEYEDTVDDGDKPALKVALKYAVDGAPAIKELKRLSTPGRRVYVGKDDIPRCRGGLGLVVVSTPKGMLSDREARRNGVGGELICSVF